MSNWCLLCTCWLSDWWRWHSGNDLGRGCKMKNGGGIITFGTTYTLAVRIVCISAACNDKPDHECACTAPLDIYPQAPPLAAPQSDKPEELPPVPLTETAPTAPNTQVVQGHCWPSCSWPCMHPFQLVQQQAHSFQWQSALFHIPSG